MSYPPGEHSRDNSGGEAAKIYAKEDFTRHFTVERRIALFIEDIKNRMSPSILVPRFHHLCLAIRKEANELMTKKAHELAEAEITTFKRRTILHQSWYSISERIYHFREKIDVQRRFDFDQLVEDIRKNAVDEAISGSYEFLPKFCIIKKKPMRSIEELKNEIDELTNLRNDLNSEIELLNAKNNNAQARRDRVTSKIDGLKWMLDEENVEVPGKDD